MNEHAHAALIRRGYDAFGSGDTATLAGLFDDNATWHEPGMSRIAGDYVGRDGVFGFFAKLAELTEGTFKAEPVDILADDDRAVVIQHTTGARDGKTLDTRDVVVFEIRDDKVVDVQLYASDLAQEDQFWS